MTTQEDVFNCAGWKALNRMGIFATMHHIFRQNYIDLEMLLKRIHDDTNMSQETFQEQHIHLSQYIFNFLASSTALTDHARRLIGFYEKIDLHKEYQQKIKESFADNKLAQFIHKLRNYQTHYQLEFPYPVRSLDDNKSWDVVFVSNDFLKHPEQWNVLSKQFIEESGQEINLNKIFAEYSKLIDTFYMWLYTELQIYHQKDFEKREKLIKESGMEIPYIPLNQPMT
mgnify:FL=1